ncbi:MAG: energy transducer TonB [Prevotellaceae bacterium]|jgi:protein TonB|nr:energy transducer TonB [Prevotellaceae bacterium]
MIEKEYIDPDKTYWIVEIMPTFQGGQAALFRFLTSNLNYPPEAVRQKQQGQVLCRFTVNKDGSISDIKIVSGVSPALDREALRVLELMPKWTSGKRKGKAVKVRFTLPVDFKL